MVIKKLLSGIDLALQALANYNSNNMPNMEVLDSNSMHCNILAKAQKLDFRVTSISTVLF